MQLVGIAGRKGAGKDTAAGVLIASHGYENVKFAGALKAMMHAFYAYVGVSREEAERMIDGDAKEETNAHLCGKTTRYALQTLGTEWGRVLIGDDIWIKAFKARAYQFDRVVCTDMRFPNEVQAIKDMNGTTLRIYDPAFVPPGQEHISESAIDRLPTKYQIANDKKTRSIESLHSHVEWLLFASERV